MLAMVAAWALTYVLTSLLQPVRSNDFYNRCVLMIHIVVSIYFCNNSIANWSRPMDGVGAASNYPQSCESDMEHGASEVMEAVLGRSAGGSRAVVVVELDFGTTFRGYAYCHKDDPEKIFMFYEWPKQASGGRQPYCKTQTSLYYAADAQGKLQLASWDWPASVEYRNAMSKALSHKAGHLVTLFKLNLASSDRSLPAESRLPAGLTAKTMITDYLREISRSIFAELRNHYGNLLRMHEVQWCLIVPTLWDDHAKQCMKTYAKEAGLVVGRSQNSSSEASRHTLEIVLELEAAAVYCLRKLKHQLSIEEHDMFLTADIGGGTVDIVVYKKLNTNSDLQLKEVVRSTGELCGGSFEDERFLEHMSNWIGCLPEFLKENLVMELAMRRWWGETKSTFNGTTSATYPVLGKLCRAWEGYDRRRDYKPCLAVDCRDEVELTVLDLCQIFDPMLALTVSLACFIYDTICCTVELPFTWEMLIHHALTILGLAYGYVH